MNTRTTLGLIVSFIVGAFMATVLLDRALQIHVRHTIEVPAKWGGSK